MRRLLGLVLLVCVLAAACGGGGGGGGSAEPTPVPITMLYVRQSGHDDNPGTSPDAALRTVGRAAQLAAPGVTIYVGPGTYVGRVDIVNVRSSASRPVQLIADVTGRETGDSPGPVLLDADEDLFNVRVSNSPNVTIDGFQMIGARSQGSADGIAVHIRSGSHGSVVRNCEIRSTAPIDGVRVQTSEGVLIFNNLINVRNRGIRLVDSPETTIISNTISNERNAALSIGRGSPAATVRNNVIQGRFNVSIAVDDEPPSSREGYTGDYNLVYVHGVGDQTKNYRPGSVRGAHDVNEDALFENEPLGDFRLRPDSPAVDAGSGMGIPPVLLNELLERSTAGDDAIDAPPVDLGYHHRPPEPPAE